MTNEEIVEKIQAGSGTAEDMEALYNQNKGIIYKTALKFKDRVSIEDLTQEAYILLDRAVHSYNPNAGIKFISYFSAALPHCFALYALENSYSVKLPQSLYIEVLKYMQCKNDFIEKYKREPTDLELKALYDYSDLKLDTVKKAYNAVRVRSMDEELTDEGFTLAETLQDESCFEEDIDNQYEKDYLRDILEEAVDRLNEMEKSVIKLRYFEGLSFIEIGKLKGVSPQYVSTINKTALKHLQRNTTLKDFFRDYDYTSYLSYHYSLNRFKNSGMSSVELLAERKSIRERRQALIYEMLKSS